MRFNPYIWKEVRSDEKAKIGKGRVRVLASAQAALYAEAEGVEVLVGFGSSWEFDTSEGLTLRLEGPQGVRWFIEEKHGTSITVVEEVYTNIDRMPHESGTLREVTRALRAFEIERRAALREIKAERRSLEKLRAKVGMTEPDAEPEPDPVSEPEPGDEAAQ